MGGKQRSGSSKQIEVVEAMRSETARTNLFADDREFVETKGINPAISAETLKADIEKVLGELKRS